MNAKRLGVLLAHRIDRAGVDAKLLAAAGGQDVQIEAGRPAFVRALIDAAPESRQNPSL